MRQLRFSLGIATIFLASGLAQAQSEDLALSASKLLSIRYTNHHWNSDPLTKDKGSIIVRDKNSGRLIKVELRETDVDSGLFSGIFRIRTGGQEFLPQIYLPKEGEMAALARAKTEKDIESSQLTRKPYFVRKDKEDMDIIQVYDRREDALAAYQEFQNWFKTQNSMTEEVQKATKVAKDAQAKAQEQARQKALADRLMERERLAALEKQRQVELKQKQAELSVLEKQKRNAEAQALAEQAMQAYQAKDFEKARELFQKSAQLDPTNNEYRFQYGVTLYKLGQFDDSLIQLDLAETEGDTETEKNYYQGLNYLKTDEYGKAKEAFEKVKTANNEVLSPPAAFYSGIIDFQNERYDLAKESFEYVLDTSKDPELDEQAEAYIEQIAKIQTYQEWSKKKWLADASVGLNYDSNILLTSDSTPDQGLASDVAGFRSLFTGSLSYRALYSPEQQLLIRFGLTNMYSVDTSFSPNEDLQKADPLMYNLSIPYSFNSELFDKAYYVQITPGYESLAMNIDGEDNGFDGREEILTSLFIDTDHTFAISPTYVTSVGFDIRQDDSKTEAQSTEDNADALKISLLNSHTFLANEEGTRAWVGEVGYTLNNADGDNQKYGRIETALTYLTPAFWESQATTRLALFQASYSDHSENRADTNISLSTGITKTHSNSLSSTYLLSYTTNDSNIDARDYQKLGLTALLSWNGAF